MSTIWKYAEGIDLQLRSFLISGLERSGLSASRPGHFTSGKGAHMMATECRRLSGPQI